MCNHVRFGVNTQLYTCTWLLASLGTNAHNSQVHAGSIHSGKFQDRLVTRENDSVTARHVPGTRLHCTYMGKKFVRLRAFTGVGLGRRFDGQAQMQIRLTAGVAPTSDPPPPPRRSILIGPPPSATSATGAPVAAARGRAMAGERGGAAQHNDAGATDHCCGVAHPAATACCGRMVYFLFFSANRR